MEDNAHALFTLQGGTIDVIYTTTHYTDVGIAHLYSWTTCFRNIVLYSTPVPGKRELCPSGGCWFCPTYCGRDERNNLQRPLHDEVRPEWERLLPCYKWQRTYWIGTRILQFNQWRHRL